MTAEMAEQELEAWVLAKCGQKRVDKTDRGTVDILVESMQEGNLILHDDETVTYKCKYTYGNDQTLEVKFKKGLKYKELKAYLKGIRQDDSMELNLAYLAGLTKTSKKVLEELDMYDITRLTSLMSFFVS